MGFKRLVYSPKAYVYIQTDRGFYNISDLVVSGSVNRRINQVSTAQVTFHNPKRQFTQPGNPTFKPMDRITIFLQRLPGFPVQVFSGYLDETPYYQMYPGTCSLRASCTLKRLKYTWFDPGLPFMMFFMNRYGWLTDGSGNIISTSALDALGTEAASDDTPNTAGQGGTGGFVQGALSNGLKPYTRKFAEALFSKGFSSTNAYRPRGATYHGSGEATDWGDSVNDLYKLEDLLWPLRDQFAELWIPTQDPPGLKHPGFYHYGVKTTYVDNQKHIHVATKKVIDWSGTSGGSGSDMPGVSVKGMSDAEAQQMLKGQWNTTVDERQGAGLSELLFAVLKHIAGWNPDQILIEELPKTVLPTIANIYMALNESAVVNTRAYQTWLKTYIGEGAQGTGGYNSGGAIGDGSLKNANITIKGVKADAEQRKNLEICLGIASDLGAPESAVLAMLVAGTQEGTWRKSAAETQYNTHKGVFQSDQIPASDLEGQCKHFLQGGKSFLAGGAIGLAKTNMSPGTIATKVEISGESGSVYDHWLPEAKKILAAWKSNAGGQAKPSGNNKTPATTTNSQSTPYHGPKYSSPISTKSQFHTPTDGVTADSNGWRPPDHKGVDLIAPEGNNAYAVCKAKVVEVKEDWWGKALPAGQPRGSAAWKRGSGVVVLQALISAGSLKKGTFIGYGHVVHPTVKENDVVNAGDVIGKVGFANAAHIHFFIEPPGSNEGDGKVDPRPYWNAFRKGTAPTGADPGETGEDPASSGDSTGFSDALRMAKTASVYATMNFPQASDLAESVMLTGERALMNDQPVLPFVEQLSKGSLRSFMSLPNGDFYAFYPDYFGAMGTAPYWTIRDLEVLEGDITLTDDNLVTHSYMIGNVFYGIDPLLSKMQTHGVVTLFNAGGSEFITASRPATDPDSKANKGKTKGGKTEKSKDDEEHMEKPLFGTRDQIIAFLQKYGARPAVEENVWIRSHVFETFYAWQNFMLAWARQFNTTFTFTFQPEIYPGGIVEFEKHGIQMFVEEVTHTWDYTSGFVTQANLTAPAANRTSRTDSDLKHISDGLILSGKKNPLLEAEDD